MPADNTNSRASYGKRSFFVQNASVFRPGDSMKFWGVLLVTALYVLISGLSQCLEPKAVHAKELQGELGPYEVIISMDPFDPERGKSQPSSSPAEGDLKDRYQIYGTIIAGEMRQAFLMVATSEPASSPYEKVANGSQKGLRAVTIGDVVDGWRVADITAQGVKFESDGEYVEVGIFDELKKERKAIAPVALQTPRPKPQVSQALQSTPAKRSSSSKPDSRSQKKSATKKSQKITEETESGSNHLQVVVPPAPSDRDFLELIKKAKGKGK
jgi:hypothetical protein